MCGELQLCVIEDQVSMQGRGSGDAMATGRGWLEPYIFCCGIRAFLVAENFQGGSWHNHISVWKDHAVHSLEAGLVGSRSESETPLRDDCNSRS